MFEQSVITSPRRPWSLAASFTIQCAVAGAVVLLSMATVQQLPSVAVPVPLPPVPRISRPPVELVATGASASSTLRPTISIPRKVFREPATIPGKIAQIVDDVSAFASNIPVVSMVGAIADGVPGAIGFGAGIAVPAFTPQAPVVKQSDTQPTERIRVGGDVQTAKLIHRIVPLYPPLARSMRISGKVRLMALIGRDGNVKELQVQSGHPLLVSTAVEAVRQWVYSPTLLNGQAVEVVAPIDVNFTMAN